MLCAYPTYFLSQHLEVMELYSTLRTTIQIISLSLCELLHRNTQC